IDCDNLNTTLERFYYENHVIYGNSDALMGLAAMTNGEYLSVQGMSLYEMYSHVSGRLGPSLMISDMSIARTEGGSGQSITIGGQIPATSYDEPFGITSTVSGTGDFIISVSMQETNSNVHLYTDTIAENMTYVLDTVADNIWAGLIQRTLYSEPQTDAMIQSIIGHSKYYRVLSKYTAFLALEPAEGPLPGPGDSDVQTSMAEVLPETGIESLTVFPNPVSDMLTLDMSLLRDMDLIIVLYDIHGAEVMQIFNGRVSGGRSMHTFDLSSLSSGMYLIRVSDRDGMPLQSFTVKK
ncbi:MAG: T9SS type A sorting domain-containing protein, partial [Flavobacteriales bacterium]|nr:T9SS type A sorting domain-containing protein [Flavobacteriales bacterium]